MFHLAAFGKTTAAVAQTNDLTFFTDPEISQRNGHMLLSEQYNVVAMAAYGAQATNAFLLSPTLNAITQFSIWPINVSDNSASPPRMSFWFPHPFPMPLNEEIQAEITQGAVADQVEVFLWLASQGWPAKLPVGLPPLPFFDVAFTFAPTGVLNQWSLPVPIVLAQNLRGGTYAVVGLELFGTNLLAGRIVFPQAYIYKGRRMRPGVLASAVLGDLPAAYGKEGPFVYGQFGQFTTAELPLIEVAASAAGAIANAVGRFRLCRVSEDININYGGLTYGGPGKAA